MNWTSLILKTAIQMALLREGKDKSLEKYLCKACVIDEGLVSRIYKDHSKSQ